MSSADIRLERLEAETYRARIENQFRARKAEGTVDRADREALRKAREAYRLNYRIPAIDGASPDSIGSRAVPEEAKTLWQRFMEMMTE